MFTVNTCKYNPSFDVVWSTWFFTQTSLNAINLSLKCSIAFPKEIPIHEAAGRDPFHALLSCLFLPARLLATIWKPCSCSFHALLMQLSLGCHANFGSHSWLALLMLQSIGLARSAAVHDDVNGRSVRDFHSNDPYQIEFPDAFRKPYIHTLLIPLSYSFMPTLPKRGGLFKRCSVSSSLGTKPTPLCVFPPGRQCRVVRDSRDATVEKVHVWILKSTPKGPS